MSTSDAAPLLRVSNHHATSAGCPPSFDGDTPMRYHSYFENAYGEQSIFVHDATTGQSVVWCGDAGWEPHPVRDQHVEGILLTPEELAWVRACILALERRARPSGSLANSPLT